MEFALVDELATLRSVTPPNQLNFLVSLDRFGTRVELASVPQWNTYGEVVGLMRQREREHSAKVMVVSTAIQLRRVAHTIRKVLADSPLDFIYCPVPEGDNLRQGCWWDSLGQSLLRALGDDEVGRIRLDIIHAGLGCPQVDATQG